MLITPGDSPVTTPIGVDLSLASKPPCPLPQGYGVSLTFADSSRF